MSDYTRRDFLKAALVGVGALMAARFLSACSPSQPVAPAAAAAIPSAIPKSPEPVSKSSDYPDIVVVKNGEPEDLVRKALETLGGIKRFVKKGDNVIIKPNIGPAMRSYDMEQLPTRG